MLLAFFVHNLSFAILSPYFALKKQEKKSFTKDQLALLTKMKEEYGYIDEKLNQFKLMIYNWNINDVVEYYNDDSFCYDYCIGLNDGRYGCKKRKNQCPFEHSQTLNLMNLIHGNSEQQDYKIAKLLCLYLMKKQIHNDNNSMLFLYYGDLLDATGTKIQDILKSEKYYVKSLSIDNDNGSAHNNYAGLLNNKLNNFDKAEYHLEKALEIDPKSAVKNYNFARFLTDRQQKHKESLIYCNKACELLPNASDCHELKGEILHKLNRFEESIDETIHALKLNEDDGYMNEYGNVNDATKLIEVSIEKYMVAELKIKHYFNNDEFEGYKLIKWLYDNQLLSIKSEILLCKMSLSMLKQCNENDIENLLAEMKLKTSDKIKFRNAVLNFDKDDSKKTESFYELKYNEMIQQVEDLKQENKKLKKVELHD